jgi:hypothetical protein
MTIFRNAILLVFAVLAVPRIASAEERTVTAYAPWEGRGQVYSTGVDRATFVGAFSGTVFVEDQHDLVLGGNIMCPGTVELDLASGAQTGSGHCVISNGEGERVYADWTCSGTQFVGCNGKFKFTAGTGSFAGISGEGDMIVRSGLQALAISGPGNIVQRAASGLVIWRNLHFTIPE